MSSLTNELNSRLATLRQQGLYRELRRVDSPPATRITVAGRSFLNFSSNDYLGLAGRPALCAAVREATDRFGAGREVPNPLAAGPGNLLILPVQGRPGTSVAIKSG